MRATPYFPDSPEASLAVTPNRMYTENTDGLRLGRRECGHIAQHGVTSQECEEAYRNGPMVIEHQRRKRERRRLCLGETDNGRLLAFVVTDRNGRIRFVTAYPMDRQQREIYRGEEE
jgi:uncharacterized DUF497 family protein